MSSQQLPTKAAPATRKAPPQVPADRQPEVCGRVGVAAGGGGPTGGGGASTVPASPRRPHGHFLGLVLILPMNKNLIFNAFRCHASYLRSGTRTR